MTKLEKNQYFTGTITTRTRKKVYQKDSDYYQQIYYKLTVTNASETRILFVYINVVSDQLWKTIEQANYSEKKYLFVVQRSKWGWILLNWEELKN